MVLFSDGAPEPNNTAREVTVSGGNGHIGVQRLGC